MKRNFLLLLCALIMASCSNYEKVLKSTDFTQRYEAAKRYYYSGEYNKASTLLFDLIAAAKGTDYAEESLYLLGLSAMEAKNFESANSYFKKYYESYPKGIYADEARIMACRALAENAPVPTLDQSDTYTAIKDLQSFVENYPNSKHKDEAMQLIFDYQERIITKQWEAAKLYYNLGTYFGNCNQGGSNYQACIVTAQNAINDYPYASRREDFATLILKSKFELAEQSVDQKQIERLQSAIDEYQGFVNEYPNSKFLPEAKNRYERALKLLAQAENHSKTARYAQPQ